MLRVAEPWRAVLMCSLLLAVAGPVRAGWGSLQGQFVYDGKAPVPREWNVNRNGEVCGKLVDESLLVDLESRGVANILVFVRSRDLPISPKYKELADKQATIESRGCCFHPHLTAIWVKQGLTLSNGDPIGHNATVQHPSQTICPLLAPAQKSQGFQFDAALPVPLPVTCNIHPWMKAWLFIHHNPYFAVTDREGRFELTDIPAGELEFQFWHEKAGYVVAKSDWIRGRVKFTIQADQATDLGTVKLAPTLFEPNEP